MTKSFGTENQQEGASEDLTLEKQREVSQVHYLVPAVNCGNERGG
jgi:hypothetical protein